MPQGKHWWDRGGRPSRVACGARIKCDHWGLLPACVIEWRDDLTATCPGCGAQYVHELKGHPSYVGGGLEFVIHNPQMHQQMTEGALTFDKLDEVFDRIEQLNLTEEERYARMQEAEL